MNQHRRKNNIGIWLFFLMAILIVSCHSLNKGHKSNKKKCDHTKTLIFMEFFSADTLVIYADRIKINDIVTTNPLTGVGRRLYGERRENYCENK
jgi:hypothetical protein